MRIGFTKLMALRVYGLVVWRNGGVTDNGIDTMARHLLVALLLGIYMISGSNERIY
jgi:hypothetical protein